ncbi:hypothetical protein G6011_11675 [Alternaria panax]|uniref:Uncharacterized protein n=1 Tax=Alternaria panax TaxID=48097 RepID=A0AAD4IDV8_9PLEO|nr:hypothetical protein G6011_11675 [Alternaria panax]
MYLNKITTADEIEDGIELAELSGSSTASQRVITDATLPTPVLPPPAYTRSPAPNYHLLNIRTTPSSTNNPASIPDEKKTWLSYVSQHVPIESFAGVSVPIITLMSNQASLRTASPCLLLPLLQMSNLNNSTPTQPVNFDTTLPTHHVPSHNSHSPIDNAAQTTPSRAAAFPPKSDNQTLYTYIVANFNVITIFIATVTLLTTGAGIIVAIGLAIMYKG